MLVSLDRRQELMTHHPFFSTLSDEIVAKLAELAYEKKYSAKAIIVSEGEMVDAVYLIVKGRIEISRFAKRANKDEMIPQGLLHVGEAIGLNDTGFFSRTLLRTATLTALSEVILIGWDIDIFCDFLKNYPQFNQALQKTTDQIARMNFIKQAAPFMQLPLPKIAKLADEIEKVVVPAGTTLFHQGEKGEKCFLIESGAVEVSMRANGTERIVAVLEPPALFGECALLTVAPRNATAKVIREATLFELQRDSLPSVVTHHSTSEVLINLVLERSYPIRHPDVIAHSRVTEEGEALTILKDPMQGRYFQLSAEGWFIWQQLDGAHTLQDITMALFKERNVFSPETVADIILNLVDAGFVSLPKLNSFLNPQNRSQDVSGLKQTIKRFVTKIMCIGTSFTKTDAFFTASYQKFIHYLYTLFPQLIMAAIVLSGCVAFFAYLPTAVSSLQNTPHLLWLLLSVFVASLFSVIFHELAHGYTVKFFQREVNHAGFLFYWIGMAVFIDTSDMWLANKRARIIVGIAGPYIDLFMAGAASLTAIYVADPFIALFFWLLALVLYYGVLKNLNPLIENDGYLILKDMFVYSSLRVDAVHELGHFFNVKKNSQPRTRPLYIYWLICIMFLFVEMFFVIVLTYHLQFILPEKLLGISTQHLIWLLPGLVMLYFLSTVFILLKKSSLLPHRE